MRRTSLAGIGLAMLLAWAGPAAAAEKPKRPGSPAKAAPAMPAASAAASAPAPSGAASAPALEEDRQRYLNQFFKTYIAPRFTVEPDSRFDDEMRAAAEAMQAEHLPRVKALLEAWLLEELKQPQPNRAFARMQARLANELAIWGRDTTGPAQDAALAQALQRSGVCRPVGSKLGDLVVRLALLRDLPPDVRREALQAERQLLARWGQPRQVDETPPLDAEEQLLRVRALGLPPKKPVPPVLAHVYLGDVDDTRRDPLLAGVDARCAMHQWAGANVAQFRAALAAQAPDLFWQSRVDAVAPTADDNPFPRMPNYFSATGLVTVQADVNAQGRLVRLSVVKRELQVPGLRDVRPFAFEGMFDLATLAKARSMDWAAAAPKEGVKTVQREFVWGLK